MSRRAPILAMLAVLGAACRTTEPTEIVLEVNTDLNHDPVAGALEIDAIEIRILRVLGPAEGTSGDAAAAPDGGPMDDAGPIDDAGSDVDASIADAAVPDGGGAPDARPACPESGEVVRHGRRLRPVFCASYDVPSADLPALPLRLGLVPGGDVTRPVWFEVTALLDGAPLGDPQLAEVRFRRNRIIRQHMWLSEACFAAGIVCPEGQTCRVGRCVDVEIPDECTPGVRDDAGDLRVCGLDASIPTDGGGGADAPGDDAGREDAGCPAGGVCTPSTTEACRCTGTRTCGADCQWGPCDGGGVCSPGDEGGACGNCDLGSRVCRADCTWACVDDDACAPGSGSSACGNCGTWNCSTSCTWRCIGEGECAPGTTQPEVTGLCSPPCMSYAYTPTCNSSCMWVDVYRLRCMGGC